MATFHLRNEIVFRAPNRVGLLADVSERLSGYRVNVLAVRGYEEDGTGVILVYPDDSRAAADALEGLEGEVSTLPVIVADIPNRPGELAAIARALSNANIGVNQVHATSSPESDRGLVVLETSNNIAALEVLQKT